MSWGSNSPSGSAGVWRVSKEATFVFRPHVSAALEQDIAIWKRQFNASQRSQEIEDLQRDNKRLRERLNDVRKEVEGLNDSKEGLKKKGDNANAAYLEQLDRELPTPHPVITPFRSVAIGCIRQLRSIKEGVDKAHDDLWHRRATSRSGILGADAGISYRDTILRVKERQTKAVSIWNRHMESFDEGNKRDWEDRTRKFKDFMAGFELRGSPLDPAIKGW